MRKLTIFSVLMMKGQHYFKMPINAFVITGLRDLILCFQGSIPGLKMPHLKGLNLITLSVSEQHSSF